MFTLEPTTQVTLVKVKWRRIWQEWDGKKIQKIPNFHPQNKNKESYRMKDFFFNFLILAFVPNFTQKTKRLGCIVS